MSSDPRARAAAYAFAQLERPATVGPIADALEAAHREADAVRSQARAEGYDEGFATGMAEARLQAQSGLAALGAAAGAVRGVVEEVAAGVEHDALGLAFALAEQILAGAVEVQPERVLDVARHALRHLSDRRFVTLVVHPDDLGLLSASVAELQASLGGIDHLAVQADRRVLPGGAIARTETGEIDAGLGVQLARARELVADALSVSVALPAVPAAAEPPVREPAVREPERSAAPEPPLPEPAVREPERSAAPEPPVPEPERSATPEPRSQGFVE